MRRLGVTEAMLREAAKASEPSIEETPSAPPYTLTTYYAGGLDHLVFATTGMVLDFAYDVEDWTHSRQPYRSVKAILPTLDDPDAPSGLAYEWPEEQRRYVIETSWHIAIKLHYGDRLPISPWRMGQAIMPCGRFAANASAHQSKCKQCHDALYLGIGRSFTTRVNNKEARNDNAPQWKRRTYR